MQKKNEPFSLQAGKKAEQHKQPQPWQGLWVGGTEGGTSGCPSAPCHCMEEQWDEG